MGRLARIARVFLVSLTAVTAWLLTSPRAAFGSDPGSAVARVRARGALLWGADRQGGEPYVYADPAAADRLVGFEVEIAEALGRALGVRAELVQCDWPNLVPTLERGDFDIALNGIEVTQARLARVDFTRPYYVFGARLMVRRDDPRSATTTAALTGRRVGTLANSFAFDLLRDVAEPVVYEGVLEPYRDLRSGRLDAVLLDDVIASRYGEPDPALRVVGDLAEGHYAIAVRPADEDLRAALDESLGRLVADGELRRILARHGLENARQARLPDRAPTRAEASATLAAADRSREHFQAGHLGVFLRAALVTLGISAAAMLVAAPLGLALALARRLGSPTLRVLAGAYVELYRGTPVLLQLYVLYFGLAPFIRLGPVAASIVGLGMNYAAYEAEAYRAGLQAVPSSQMDAALALGMSRGLALRRVVLPQAVRHAIPNVANDFIALLKDSALVSVITVVELTKQMTITAVDVRSWLEPGLACAALYLAMSYPLGRIARRIERRLEGERPRESPRVPEPEGAA